MQSVNVVFCCCFVCLLCVCVCVSVCVCVHSVKHLSAGFTVLLDAHSSKTHTSTKQILEKMVNVELTQALVTYIW